MQSNSTKRGVMGLSIFLAKLFGLYLLIIPLIWIFRKDAINETIRAVAQNRALLAFSGAINLILGLAIIIGHPVWEMNWRVIITLLGYLMLFVGFMRFAFTDFVQNRAQMLLSHGYHWIILIISLLLGLILTYYGFMA